MPSLFMLACLVDLYITTFKGMFLKSHVKVFSYMKKSKSYSYFGNNRVKDDSYTLRLKDQTTSV